MLQGLQGPVRLSDAVGELATCSPCDNSLSLASTLHICFAVQAPAGPSGPRDARASTAARRTSGSPSANLSANLGAASSTATIPCPSALAQACRTTACWLANDKITGFAFPTA